MTTNQAGGVLVLGPGAYLQGSDLVLVQALARHGVRRIQERDAIAPSPDVVRVLSTLDRAVTLSSQRQPVAPDWLGPTGSVPVELGERGVGLSTTEEAARAASTSTRTAQRRASQSGASRFGSRWLWDRRSIDVLAALVATEAQRGT